MKQLMQWELVGKSEVTETDIVCGSIRIALFQFYFQDKHGRADSSNAVQWKPHKRNVVTEVSVSSSLNNLMAGISQVTSYYMTVSWKSDISFKRYYGGQHIRHRSVTPSHCLFLFTSRYIIKGETRGKLRSFIIELWTLWLAEKEKKPEFRPNLNTCF